MNARTYLSGGLMAALLMGFGARAASAQATFTPPGPTLPAVVTKPPGTAGPTGTTPAMATQPVRATDEPDDAVAPAPVMATSASAPAAPAATGAAPASGRRTVLSEAMVNIPAGGEATLAIRAYCLNFGEPFPVAVTASTSRANDDAVKVLKAAAMSGAGSSDQLSTQLAVWNAVEGRYGYFESDVDLSGAKALTAASQSLTTAPLSTKGMALDQAIRDGVVSATVEGWSELWAPLALPNDSPYYGGGTLRIRNLTTAAVDVYAPLGMVLRATNPGQQDMGVYAVQSTVVVDTPQSLPKTGGARPGAATWLVLVAGICLAGMLRRRMASVLVG